MPFYAYSFKRLASQVNVVRLNFVVYWGRTMVFNVPTYKDVAEAAERLFGHINKTPVIRHDILDVISGLQLYLKDETAQKTGTFKYRGAYSRMSLLTPSELNRGVVAFSSGNHAQGVALAAKELGTTAIIVMPKSVPVRKKEGTLSLGAKIVEYDIATQSREKIAAQIARDENRVVVPAFDDLHVIAGQGSCGVEFIQQCRLQGTRLDAIITPMGGGGLCAGVSLASKSLSPHTKIYGAEPIEYDDHYHSLKAGVRQHIGKPSSSICDALMSPMPGEITFAINQASLSGVLRVTDKECLLTMALVKDVFRVELEPGGAAALAAVLSGRSGIKPNAHVGVILSGGNVDQDMVRLAEQTKSNLLIGPAG